MAINLDIRLKKADKVYHEGENITGVIVIQSNSDIKHDGITITMEGAVNLQLSSKNVGIFEAFYNSVKPIQLVQCTADVASSGKIPSGTLEIPFELPLQAKQNRTLYETYHGVFVNISYNIRCEMKRSFLAKDVCKVQQFIVQYKVKSKPNLSTKPMKFSISPETLQNKASDVPRFKITGYLDSTICDVQKPFSGEIVVESSSKAVRSLELQLVRVETCGCAEGYAKDATEIQNIQIGEGDVPRNIPIPIYMIFPRLFTCPTLITPNFKVEFEINLVIVFEDDHLVTENFPVALVRV